MAIVINGSGTVTGLAVGGLPDGTVDSGTIATGTIVDADVANVAASKLTGALPAISGASLTNLPSKGKNLIINGDFSVNQRGTAATTGGTYLTADRFKAGATNVTFETVANDRDLSIPNMLKVTSHTTGYGIIVQPIEDVHTASGKNVTLSFWAKTANFSSFRLEMSQNFGSGGSTAVEILNNTSYWSVPDTGWNKYTATIAIPSISGKTIGIGSHLNIVFGSNSGTSNGITYFSEVQVELGSVATDFEQRSYGEELALCQRYFYKDKFNVSMLPWANSGGGFQGQTFMHNPEMRDSPTITQDVIPSYSNITGASGPQSQNTYSTSVNVTTSGDAKSFRLSNNVSGATIYAISSQLSFSAEL